MKATELLRFVLENEIEYHWHENEGVEDVIMFVYKQDIEVFIDLLPESLFEDNDSVMCTMKKEYFCFWMYDICKWCGIELEDVFKKDR